MAILDSFINSVLQYDIHCNFCFNDIDVSALLSLAGLMMHVYL
jgi:hypothetical protein